MLLCIISTQFLVRALRVWTKSIHAQHQSLSMHCRVSFRVIQVQDVFKVSVQVSSLCLQMSLILSADLY